MLTRNIFCEKLIESSTINKKIKYVVLRYFNAAGANSSGTIGEKKIKKDNSTDCQNFFKKTKETYNQWFRL